MNSIEPLINEAIVELRAYMFQLYSDEYIPVGLLKVEELLLDTKDKLDRDKNAKR